MGNKVPYKKNKGGKRLPVCSCHVTYKMVECSFTNKVVLGLSAVAVTWGKRSLQGKTLIKNPLYNLLTTLFQRKPIKFSHDNYLYLWCDEMECDE